MKLYKREYHESGSGKKLKFCCLEVVRDNLPNNPTQAESTMEVRKAKQPYGLINDIDIVEDREAIRLMQKGIQAIRGNEPYASSGDEIAAQKMLKDFGLAAVTLDMSIEQEEKLEGEDDKLFKETARKYISA